MSIQENWQKFKSSDQYATTLLTCCIVIVSVVSFVCGRLSVPLYDDALGKYTAPEVLQSAALQKSQSTTSPVENPAGGYVASKSGTKYHLPWCGSAQQIKASNKVWFATKEEAEVAGYTPAANCKGI